MKDVLGYQGKQVAVTGAASGIGQAAAQLLVDLGAEVYALDIKQVTVPIHRSIETDLKDKDAIDAAVTQLPDEIDALFNCAGLPGPPFSDFDTTLVNFVGHRHLTESLIPRMKEGSAIATISSLGAMGWRSNREAVFELVGTEGFEEGRAWLRANPDRNWGYALSKQCLIVYTKARAGDLAKREIRINCISPSTTVTPMLEAFEAYAGKEWMWEYFRPPCDRYATAEEMAEPLVFLNSTMARFISGQNICVDYGYWAAVDVGQRDSYVG